MMAKPFKALEFYYPIIQFLLTKNISTSSQGHTEKHVQLLISSQSYNKVQIKDDDDDDDNDDDDDDEQDSVEI